MRLVTIKDRSRVWLEARSNLHAIQSEAEGLEGDAEVVFLESGFDLRVAPRAKVRLPVDQLRSGNGLQDADLHRRMEVQKYPEITAELRGVQALEGVDSYRFVSDLTVHGITRRIDVDVTGVIGRDGTVVVDGEFVIDVRNFEVTPPRIFDLQVYPEVKVRVRLVLAPAETPASA